VLKPFGELARRDLAALATDATDVARYLGIPGRSPMGVTSDG
jgi:hypothetical protein